MTADAPTPTGVGAAPLSPAPARPAPATLVWIDAREATVVRRKDGVTRLQIVKSDVEPRHRATGHVRHDPGVRHGGGGPPQTAGEPRRLEHLARFLGSVADALPDGENLVVLGPGTVHERLARLIEERDRDHRIHRRIVCEPAARMTRLVEARSAK